ncbi:MAG: 23S rRNA (adenine(1618)-N(6))-methyltransferase RlmF [Dokdonella sp.]
MKPTKPAPEAAGPHPRNRHQGRYNLPALSGALPELRQWIVQRRGDSTVDFSDQRAVLALNRALLAHWYRVRGWELPAAALCPGVPGRADLIHYLADLLASDHGGKLQRGPSVRVLDIGVGASAVYPLIGAGEYGWSFVGVDVSLAALDSAKCILAANPTMAASIELRRQYDAQHIFDGVIGKDEHFDLSLCNPPFHLSARAVKQASVDKWRKLGKATREGARGSNFGGMALELHCAGGELGFISRMIEESVRHQQSVRWFSSLVSKAAHVPTLRKSLHAAGATDIRQIEMGQGQKLSRVLAWTFQEGGKREAAPKGCEST